MIFLAQPYTHHFKVGLQCAQSVSPDLIKAILHAHRLQLWFCYNALDNCCGNPTDAGVPCGHACTYMQCLTATTCMPTDYSCGFAIMLWTTVVETPLMRVCPVAMHAPTCNV